MKVRTAAAAAVLLMAAALVAWQALPQGTGESASLLETRVGVGSTGWSRLPGHGGCKEGQCGLGPPPGAPCAPAAAYVGV